MIIAFQDINSFYLRPAKIFPKFILPNRRADKRENKIILPNRREAKETGKLLCRNTQMRKLIRIIKPLHFTLKTITNEYLE